MFNDFPKNEWFSTVLHVNDVRITSTVDPHLYGLLGTSTSLCICEMSVM